MLNKLYEYIHTLIRRNTITTCLKKCSSGAKTALIHHCLDPTRHLKVCCATWHQNVNKQHQRVPKVSQSITQPVPASFIPCSAAHVSIADGQMFIVSVAITPCNYATNCNALFISTTLLRICSPRSSLVLSWIIFDEDHKHSTSAVVREMQLLLLTYQFWGRDANIHIASWWRDNQHFSRHLSYVKPDQHVLMFLSGVRGQAG